MSSVPTRRTAAVPFWEPPTSVILIGSDRPLLNWTAFAFASLHDEHFVWTDIRLDGEGEADGDPVTRGVVPESRHRVVYPYRLTAGDGAPPRALHSLLRADESSEELERLTGFLRLPAESQEYLATDPRQQGGTLVVSNVQRLAALYAPETVGPMVRAIESTGRTLVATFADEPPEARTAFGAVLHLVAESPAAWRDARLRVEKAPGGSSLRPGAEYRLAELDGLASNLGRWLS